MIFQQNQPAYHPHTRPDFNFIYQIIYHWSNLGLDKSFFKRLLRCNNFELGFEFDGEKICDHNNFLPEPTPLMIMTSNERKRNHNSKFNLKVLFCTKGKSCFGICHGIRAKNLKKATVVVDWRGLRELSIKTTTAQRNSFLTEDFSQ